MINTMNIIKTGIGITKTIKNVARFREILSVFAKHGFDEFILKTKLNTLIPNFVIPKSRFEVRTDELSESDFWEVIGYRLRLSFEELGPSFIKVGQLLATREDIFDPSFIDQLKLLQDKAKPINFSESKIQIETELEKKFEEIFESFNETPIGVASIGVVYEAKLKNGEEVVVKVQRPNIQKTITTDFEIIAYIVSQLERFSDEIKYLGISRAIDDFFKGIILELNFLIEANNNQKISSNIKKIDEQNIFKIPKIHKEFTTKKILIMEKLSGVPFSRVKDIKQYPKLQNNLISGVKMFMHNMLNDGFFHADLHGGNFFHLEEDKIGLIDFGLVGVLSKKNRTNLVAILYALLTNNYENLVFEFLDVADYETIPHHEELVRDIRDALTPFIGLSVQEMDVTALTNAIVRTLSKHQIYLPREWFIIFRALMTLDGVGKSLNIDLNIFEIIEDEIQSVMSELVSKEAILEETVWLGRDVINSVRILPRHLRWLLKEFAKKKYSVDINLIGISNQIQQLNKMFYFLGMIILTATFFIAGVTMMHNYSVASLSEIPVLTYICWGLALSSFVSGTYAIKT